MTHPPLRIGIIGGTGLGEALGAESGQTLHLETPFGPPSSPIILAPLQNPPAPGNPRNPDPTSPTPPPAADPAIEVAILQRHGVGHVHNPSRVPYRANIYALKSLGVTHIIASGATGSLREHIHPGDLVIPDQIIDKTYKRESTFYDRAAVHVELADPFCPIMRQWLLAAAKKLPGTLPGAHVHDKAAYLCMEGPAFSTQAESLLHRSWGADLIGMTAMPEARLAREAEIAYALIALPTDYDCWRPHDPAVPPQDLLTEILGNLKKASAAGLDLIKTALADTTTLRARPSPAHSALKLAIWSDKSKIDRAEIESLRILWGKYF